MENKEKVLGNAIREARLYNNLSQENLAELVGITPTHLKHLESEHRKPSIEVLFKLAKILHMSIDNIVFRNGHDEFNHALVLLKSCNENELILVADIIKSILKHRL